MMKKKQSIIALVLAAIVTVLLGWTMIKGWGPTGTGSMKNINLGLDLSGGVSITYQAVKDNPTDEEMSDTRYKLEQRAQQYSEEAQVYLQGDNRITIEIPGATDATTILEEMGKPGSLYFIKQTNDDGTENYTYDSSTGEYVLNGKTIEELEEDGSVVLTGKDVESAEAMHQQNSTTKATESVVQLKMTDEGKQKFADATQEAYSAGKSIGIYYDEKFVSVPSVNAVISDGTAVISGGNMDWDEATSLASTLRIGSLSLKLEEINSSVVGAQLGSAAVSTSVKAGAIGIVLIILFLAIVYRLPGIAAGWALLIYVELNLISLNAFDLTLTLPGIAGVILSIGMAVDANVIIYARIEEEIGAGKTVHAAIRDGFKKAASAILDGNVTTLIAAAVLYALASGSVRGFAMTLALGIVLSMFSAMVVSRLLVNSLASTLRIGSLSLKLEEINSSVVGAQLGSAAVSTSVKAGAIGIVLIILFLAIVYRLPGIAAGWALLIYVELNLIALNAFDLTLTLPGIAGVILSIGMAVDANVIIYARIEEEIGAGKTVHAAIRDGFKKAASAILDGNVTTLIAAAVLYALASGSVRGFAMTLALGIVLSMFSAMVVSRLLVNSLYGMGLKDAKYYGTKKERKGFPFVEKRKIFFTISCILLLAVPASMIFMHQTKGSALNFGLDFKGGTSINVPFNEDYSIEELDKEVEPVVEGVTKDSNIQMTKVVGGNNVIIKTRSLTLEEREQVYQAMADNFGVDTSEITFDNISSTVSKEMSQNAMKAVIIAVVCMLLYIWIRFRDIRFASSAILALMHDIAIVFGFYVVSRISVGSTFIACMLTILGYSINSTIVIFDRIRENLPELKREPIESLVDRCITDTLTRSIYSSLTTFITIFVLFVMGVSSIRDFAAPLMVGIVCGAYTSVCITGALWYVMKHVGKNKYVPSKAVQNKTKNK